MIIEIWSDIACPWCYIGKVRFERALDAYEEKDAVSVKWRSFELAPQAPRVSPGTTTEHLMAKYGRSREQIREMMANVTAVAAQEGLAYRLEEAVAANTFDAHRLIHFADAAGVGHAMTTLLMQAYQCDAADVSDHATLVRYAQACGLDATEVQRMLAGDEFADAVRADQARGRRLGVQGVPFFVIDETHGVSGAQPTEFFLGALRELGPKPRPISMLGGAETADGVCTDDGCEVPQA